MTEKLYYKDAYCAEFDANVIEVRELGGKVEVLLDKTAFFPEEGGQTADCGDINGIRVLDVRLADGLVWHVLEECPTSTAVHGRLDFATRFEKMQCHTAEHILCGIIHRLYRYENVGFHLGEDVVTFDIDGELSKDQLEEIELLANRAVFENRRIITEFPSPDEQMKRSFRSKLEISEGLRLVEIEGIDVCACCAPHVASTGEVGLIKLLDFMRHRGGMRINMVAGYRALRDYSRRYNTSRHIGALTSTPSLEIADAVDRLNNECEVLRRALSEGEQREAQLIANSIQKTDGSLVLTLPSMSAEAMRELSNLAICKVGRMLVLLSGSDGEYKYIISSRTQNLRELSVNINKALCGRGGGRPEMIQGSFAATLEEIESYFK